MSNISELRDNIKNFNFLPTGSDEEIRLCCPDCGENSYHLYFNTSKKLFNCKKCNYSGFCDVELDIFQEKRKEEKRKKFSGELPEFCKPLTKNEKNKVARKALKYLYGRGITYSDINFYNIHYCFYGEYINRVVFPFIRNDELCYFVARTFTNAKKKILNPTGQKELFNIENAAKYGEIVLVEGVFDAIMTGDNAVAVLGHDISDYQCDILESYGIKDINVMFDPEVSLSEIEDLLIRIARKFRTVKYVQIPLGIGDPGKLKLRNFGLNSWKKFFKVVKYDCFTRWKNTKIWRT